MGNSDKPLKRKSNNLRWNRKFSKSSMKILKRPKRRRAR